MFSFKAGNFLRQLYRLLLKFSSSPRDSWRQAKPSDVLFFSSDLDRSVVLDGLAFGKIMGPFQSLFETEGYSALSVGSPGDRKVGRLASASTISISRLFIPAAVEDLLRNTWRSAFGLVILNRFAARERAYVRLFRTLEPKFIFALNSTPEMCLAARRLRIPIVEVLHSRGHGYIPKVWQTRSNSDYPDGIIAYNGLSTEVFKQLLPVLQVPNFRIEFEQSLARRFLKVQPPPFAQSVSPYRTVVLFTASYFHEDGSWPSGLPEALVELVSEDQDIFLLVRMHPVMLTKPSFAKARKGLQKLIENCPNCDLQWASKAPLYAVLQVATIHFTFDSMSAYEAADIGMISLAIDDGENIPGRKMEDLRHAGFLKNIKTSKQDMKQAIKDTPPRASSIENDGEISVAQMIEFAERVSRERL